MKIYRPTDRIPVKIGEVTFWLAPLSYQRRSELLAAFARVKGESTPESQLDAALKTVAWGLRDIDGVEEGGGAKYELEFNENGDVTESCVRELFDGLGRSDKLVTAAGTLLLMGVEAAGKLDGVEIDPSKVFSVKKNPTGTKASDPGPSLP